MIDVSSVKELARRWFPEGLLQPAGKGAWRTAPWRILWSPSIELDYYRRAVFVEQPGPESSEAAQHALDATASYQAFFVNFSSGLKVDCAV